MATTVFKFMAPVFVTVEDGVVVKVVVDDSVPVEKPKLVEGRGLKKAVAASLDGQSWPSWEFGW